MLLNSIIVDSSEAVDKPVEAFVNLENQKSILRVKEEIKTALLLNNYMCNILLKFVVAVTRWEFIVQASEDSGKFSLFYQRIENKSGLDSNQSLRIQLLLLEEKELEKETIKRIVKEKLVEPEYIYNLKYLLKLAVYFSKDIG